MSVANCRHWGGGAGGNGATPKLVNSSQDVVCNFPGLVIIKTRHVGVFDDEGGTKFHGWRPWCWHPSRQHPCHRCYLWKWWVILLLLIADWHFCHCWQCQINSTYPLFVQGHFGKNIDELFFYEIQINWGGAWLVPGAGGLRSCYSYIPWTLQRSCPGWQ